jgi:hypothetical protein
MLGRRNLWSGYCVGVGHLELITMCRLLAVLLFSSTFAPATPPSNGIGLQPVNVDQDATCRLLTENICRKNAFCRWDYRADVCLRR